VDLAVLAAAPAEVVELEEVTSRESLSLFGEQILARIPHNPEEVFEEVARDYGHVFGGDLVAVILYGSAARGEYVKGVSDINFLLVVSEEGMRRLGRCLEVADRWRKRAVAVPLFMTREYIASSLDSFPIEFINMQRYHKVIQGEDVLVGLQFDKSNLRLQLERETKGKALHLWQSYLAFGRDKKALRRVLLASLTSLTSIFVGILYYKDQPIPDTSAAVIRSVTDVFELDGSLFDKLRALRGEEWKGYRTQLVDLTEAYLHEMEKIYKIVDAM